MSEPEINSDMTIKEAYEIMKEHYRKSEYYIDMGECSLYIGIDRLIQEIEDIRNGPFKTYETIKELEQDLDLD